MRVLALDSRPRCSARRRSKRTPPASTRTAAGPSRRVPRRTAGCVRSVRIHAAPGRSRRVRCWHNSTGWKLANVSTIVSRAFCGVWRVANWLPAFETRPAVSTRSARRAAVAPGPYRAGGARGRGVLGRRGARGRGAPAADVQIVATAFSVFCDFY